MLSASHWGLAVRSIQSSLKLSPTRQLASGGPGKATRINKLHTDRLTYVEVFVGRNVVLEQQYGVPQVRKVLLLPGPLK